MNSQKSPKGFTIIEVMLFIAVSGFLFVGITMGAGANIARQRYKTSVQDLTEFLRAQYSAVASTQISERQFANDVDRVYCASTIKNHIDEVNWSWKGGAFDAANFRDKDQARARTDCLVYGKILVFGDRPGIVSSYSLLGNDYYQFDDDKKLEIERSADPTLTALRAVSVSPFTSQMFKTCSLNTNINLTHNIEWGATAEVSTSRDLINVSIMIARSPIDGAIHTYVLDSALPMNQIINKNLLSSDGSGESDCVSGSNRLAFLASNSNLFEAVYPAGNAFEKKELEVCIGSHDLFSYGGNRRMIRIAANGHNSSAVELMSMDSLRPDNDPNLDLRGEQWCQ